ncbi:MAG: SEC-C metal-binding domain-containing protein [Gammaproteobacteria bacterium]|nr:SEC-C metal-binding domain-containing protein [Gammaproteobacteria bacterium]
MTKIGRNDPCPCGSGKKYKHCCREQAQTRTRVPSPVQGRRTPRSTPPTEHTLWKTPRYGPNPSWTAPPTP